MIARVLALLIVLAGLYSSLNAPAFDDRDSATVLVVCPKPLQAGLTEWVSYREEQGYTCRIIEPAMTAEATIESVRNAAKESQLSAILLIGKPDGGKNSCPVGYMAAEVNIAFGSEPTIPTDNFYADLDDDFLPDIAIGRIPVETSEKLEQILERSIRYESNPEQGEWRRRINLVAGVGGFDPILDRVIETSTQGIINQMMPEQYAVSMTWGSWTSPYCPAPSRFSQTVVERFNEGCLFWVYVGHGDVDRLDRVNTPNGRYSILDNSTVPWLSSQHGNPIALMLCCYTCAFDARSDCLAQKMLEQPQGPVAVIGGTRMTMPYGMGRLSVEMMDELFKGNCQTLGEMFHQSKRRLMSEEGDDELRICRSMIQSIAESFSPFPEKLDQELREHVAMMHLLGDPLLRISRPLSIPTLAKQATAGESMQVSGEAPVGGKLTVEACYSRGRFWNRPSFRQETDLTIDRSEWLQSDYEKCRDVVCSQKSIDVEPGPFTVELPIPEKARGNAVIRTFIDGTAAHAAGATAILIERVRR